MMTCITSPSSAKSCKPSSWQACFAGKLVDPVELEQFVADLRQEGKTIATLNGSFDLLHAGHLYFIYEASKTADVLLVALNSDSSIKQYKSPKRPIITLDNRLQMVAALGFVDYVTWFDETDPRAFLERVKPDVHVNGAEYGQECVEAPVVRKYGRLHLVDRIPGLSTSEVLQRARECD